MNLYLAQSLANELMTLHNVRALGYTFKWHNRKHAAGTCSYSRKTIYLSKILTHYATDAEVKDTILHEIAHALTEGHGHDHVWVAKAKEIGCDGRRCYNDESKPNLVEAQKHISKYKAVCINGHESFANRMPKHRRSCGTCSRRFDERYILNYTLNR